MHLLFLTDNFPPEVNAPASRTFEHCREWVRDGQKVTVITCVPNFPRGKVYEGYRNRLWQTELMEGIRIIRVWSYITANEGFVKRILDYASFMIAAILTAPFIHKVDLVIGTSPHFFTVCGACLISRVKHRPFVFELRDIWPESIKAVGAMGDSPIIHFLEKVEMLLYRKAARIVSVTESFKQILKSRGVEECKIEVITNGVDLNGFRPQPKDAELLNRYGLVDKFVVGYVGTHGMAHALETIIEAAARIQERTEGKSFRFIFLGDGARKKALEALSFEKGLRNVLFINSVSKEDVARYWALLDVSIIHLRKTELFRNVIPSKLFEAMAMGIPVLHGVSGESAEIVDREGVGMIFEPENVEDLVSKLICLKENKDLYDRLKKKCTMAAKNYDRRILARKMLNVLENVH